MSAPFALFSLDYPPERGGVARYLGDLVAAAGGGLDVFVPETHAVDGPGAVAILPTFARGPWAWRPLVRSLFGLRKFGFRGLLVSHLLPVGTAAFLASALGGLPYAVLVHGLDLRLAVGRRRKRWLARLVLRNAGAVFTNSRLVAADVRALDPRIEPVVVTPAVVPRPFPPRDEARASLAVPPDAFLCVTVARLVSRKGIDRFIETLSRLSPDVRYVVIGDGEDRARLEALAAAHAPGRVTFLTGSSDDERDRWLAAADLFVFLARESSGDVEGFGIACLEAALAGLPVLAGRSGGVPEAVLEGETGLLADPEDTDAIVASFGRLHADAALRARLGAAGRARVLHEFAWPDRWDLVRERLSHL